MARRMPGHAPARAVPTPERGRALVQARSHSNGHYRHSFLAGKPAKSLKHRRRH